MPEYMYVVLSKRLHGIRFQLSADDLSINRPARQRKEPSLRPRIKGVVSRHKVAIAVIAVSGAVVAVAAAVVLGYGFNWKKQFHGYNSTVAGEICPAGDGRLFAIGSGDNSRTGYLYTCSNGKWAQVPSVQESFSDISAVDSKHAWISCLSGAIYFYDGKALRPQFYATTQGPEDLVSDRLSGIEAIDKDHAWAVGTRTVFEKTRYGYGRGSVGIVYSFDGKSWSVHGTLGDKDGLEHISAADNNHVWVTSPHSVYFYNGSVWVRQFATPYELNDIFALDPQHVWATGYSRGEDNGAVFFFDGSKWTTARVEKAELGAIFALDADHVWVACGASPETYNKMRPSLLVSSGKGDWKVMSCPNGEKTSPYRSYGEVRGVCASAPRKVWVSVGQDIFYGSTTLF